MVFRSLFFSLIMPKQKERVFYAVGIGHNIGIYNTWTECKKQIDGVANPKFRKFTSLEEAQQFVNKWQNNAQNVSLSPNSPKPLYGVCNYSINERSQEEHYGQQLKGELGSVFDNNASTYDDDMEKAERIGDAAVDIHFLMDKVENCERKVDICVGRVGEILSGLTDIKNELMQLKTLLPRNNAVLSKKMDTQKLSPKLPNSEFSRAFFLNCNTLENERISKPLQQDSQRIRKSRIESTSSSDVYNEASPPKRKRTWDKQSSTNLQEPKLENEMKQERDNSVSFTTDEDDYVVVYTDGSCMYNGTQHAKAGIGIWFDDGHPLNVSRPLSGAEPTNNNAEIQAARIACELALGAGISKLKICTDSEFLINCITKWVHRWKENGWSTGANKPVKNRAELEKLLEVTSRLSVRWEKVAGHSDIKGNEMADRLANEGAAYLNVGAHV